MVGEGLGLGELVEAGAGGEGGVGAQGSFAGGGDARQRFDRAVVFGGFEEVGELVERDAEGVAEGEGVVGGVGEVGDDAVEPVGVGGGLWLILCVRRVHDARVLRRRGGSRRMRGMTTK